MIDTSLIKITNYLTSIESLNYYMTDFNKIGCIKNNGNKISNKLMKSYCSSQNENLDLLV